MLRNSLQSQPWFRKLHLAWLKRQPFKCEVFYRELGGLLLTGFPITQALDFLNGHGLVPETIKEELIQGAPFSQSLARVPKVAAADLRIIGLAEETGDLAQSLIRLAEDHRKNRELKGRLSAFAVYPIIMFIMITAYILFSLFFMVPMLCDLLRNLNVSQGFIFQLDSFRQFLLDHRYPVIGLVSLGVILTIYLVVRYQGMLRLVLGPRYKLYRELLFIEPFSKLLAGGQSVFQSLALLAGLSFSVEAMSLALKEGEPLSQALKAGGLSPECVAVVRLAEEDGQLVAGLDRYLANGRKIIETTMERRIKLLEPVTMILIGAVVGTTMTSIMGPLMDAFGRIQ